MANNIDEFNTNETSEGAKTPVSKEKLKEYGKKAYAPLLNVVTKYQDEFTPYLNALVKGLQSGADSLCAENATDVEKYVGNVFKEANEGLKVAIQKLDEKDIKSLSTYLSEMAAKKPSLMFSTSYVTGLFFGRLGRHIIAHSRSVKERQSLH